MKDEFGGEIVTIARAPTVDEFGSPITQAAPPDPSMVQQIGNALKSGGSAALKAMDVISHLGQPQWAKDLVQSIATDPKNAPPNPQQVAQKPSFLEAMGSVMPGQGMPTPPAGMDMRPLAAAGVDQATSPSTYLSAGLSGLSKIPALAKLAQAAGRVPGAAATAIGSKLTHIPGEALAEASTAAGRAGLADAAKAAPMAGEQLADHIGKLGGTPQEIAVTKSAVKQMGPIDLQPAIDAMEKAKIQPQAGVLLPEDAAANAKIQAKIDALKQSNGRVSGVEAKALNERIGKKVSFDDPHAEVVNAAGAAGYKALAKELEAAATRAGRADYAPAMKSMSGKFDLQSELQDMIGKEEGARQDVRAANFLQSVWKTDAKGNPLPGAVTKQNLLAKLDKTTGSDWLAQSKKLSLAKEFGPTGTPSLTPKVSPFQALGEAASGAALAHYGHPAIAAAAFAGGVAGSSPALAVRAIQAANTLPAITSALGRNASVALAAAQRLAAARSQNEADFYSTKLQNFGLNQDQIKTLSQGQ